MVERRDSFARDIGRHGRALENGFDSERILRKAASVKGEDWDLIAGALKSGTDDPSRATRGKSLRHLFPGAHTRIGFVRTYAPIISRHGLDERERVVERLQSGLPAGAKQGRR